MIDRIFSNHIFRPVIWGLLTLLFAAILSVLPQEWVERLGSLNILHGHNPSDMAIYWISSVAAYLTIHIITYNAGHPLRFNFIDLTLWLLSLAVPAVINNAFPGFSANFAGAVTVYLLSPLTFCIVLHLALRPFCASMREASTENAENEK